MTENASLEPAVVIPIFAVCGAMCFVVLGVFAQRKPTHPFVSWLDRNFTELLVTSFLVTLIALVVTIPLAPSEAQAILPCCFITWMLFVAFAAIRYRECEEEILGTSNTSPQQQQHQPNIGIPGNSSVVVMVHSDDTIREQQSRSDEKLAVVYEAAGEAEESTIAALAVAEMAALEVEAVSSASA